jgi:hypothetical protein
MIHIAVAPSIKTRLIRIDDSSIFFASFVAPHAGNRRSIEMATGL